MKTKNRWQIVLALVAAIAILVTHPSQKPVQAFPAGEAGFVDTGDHWAGSCIGELARRQILSGYGDNTFRPEAPITRAEFAAVVNRAFPTVPATGRSPNFVDIPTDYWAYDAIQEATKKGFLSGYIGSIFNPTVKIPRVQALVAIATGLGYEPQQLPPEQLGNIFRDGAEIPEYATEAIAAATENWLVVNYPDVRVLNPNRQATRGEVASFICQAIVDFDETALVPSQYIARIPVSDLQTPQTKRPEDRQQKSQLRPSELPEREPQIPEQVPQSPPAEPEPQPEVSREESREEPREATTKTAEFDGLQAELSYNPSPTPQLNFKVIRRGEVVLDAPIPETLPGELISVDFAKSRILDISSLDLDGDKEPEVILDFKNGNYYSLIYHYKPFGKEYAVLPKNWGEWGYDLQEIGEDESPRFVGYDPRFAEVFDVRSQLQLPIQIWEYRYGELRNVTVNYPEIVESHLDRIWSEVEQLRRLNRNIRGGLAAYLANQYSLNRGESGWRRVRSVYQGADADEFFADLRRFLIRTGYIQP
ncbi:S-layer homology domain-containing protein [Lyngbya sp. CCY1209]|uniref:S-layer homology domain-containing protein n=1 Tax=Lyngbya sp. CCY1209 TaxID=2886103 RepID=UPI002D207FDF|nr:S-layer homology domain-containing protein [Lyngbya sp. CCY1209]MEB3886885.1 S-layer homology domain-containing protein [Lyngbya sp. CCY1209]